MTPDASRIVVTGTDYSTETFQDFATIAYDPTTGDQLWVDRYTSRNYNLDVAGAIAATPDGSAVFVTGYSWNHPSLDFVTIAYVPATGDQLWISSFDQGDDRPTALEVSPDGSTVYVTGFSIGGGSFAFSTVAYDAGTGSTAWSSHTTFAGDESALDLAVSPDGARVFVTGEATFGVFRSDDYLTVAYAG